MRCITPSGKIISGSPVSLLNSKTKPVQRLPGAAGTFRRRCLPSMVGKERMSELIRTAPTPRLAMVEPMHFSR
ncbi:MAG: hypothetical protein O2912_02645 [Proteobacteria bacterium]|nr:hypothetical protein [Pseudomonadota bacterium]